LPALACVVFCACSFGQSEVPSYRQPVQIVEGQSAKPSPATSAPSASPSAPPAAAHPAASPVQTPPSLLDHPAEPAKINLQSRKLTIQADNSTLSDILRQVQKQSGMKIEGLQTLGNNDQRIFGKYGPGDPRDVLLDLLSGYGFNVLMLGETTAGTPRELALTSRTSPVNTGTPAPPTPGNAPDQNQENGDQPPEDQQPPDQEQQQINYAPPPTPPEMRNGIRTPQQIMQQLQMMRQQQQEQQQQQQQQQEEQQQQ
jgi:hypothetical protein